MENPLFPRWHAGDVLRKAREHAQLTQADLASRLGLSPATIARAESGATPVKVSTVYAWATGTGVALSWLEQALETVEIVGHPFIEDTTHRPTPPALLAERFGA